MVADANATPAGSVPEDRRFKPQAAADRSPDAIQLVRVPLGTPFLESTTYDDGYALSWHAATCVYHSTDMRCLQRTV
jgi:hypothetical protein